MATTRIGFSFLPRSAASSSPFHFQRCRRNSQLLNQPRSVQQLQIHDKSSQFIHGMPKLQGRLQKQQTQTAMFVCSDDQSRNNELETAAAATVPENHDSDRYRRDIEVILSNLERTENNALWFMSPAILVTSFMFPQLYMPKILSLNSEETSLVAEACLILFYIEAIFYCGVAVFLCVLDHILRRNTQSNWYTRTPPLGQRISFIARLVVGVIIPMVTLSSVFPWVGPIGPIALAPYMLGTVVQFKFEKLARNWKSPSWAAIPIIFQVYRLHQLYNATEVVTSLSRIARGTKLTFHNIYRIRSLGAISIMLQFLLVISIWSIISFLMRFLPVASATMW